MKHIESLQSVQSKAVRFIGNLRGRGGVSKKREELGLNMMADRRKNKRLNMFHFILTQSTCASYNELSDFIDNCFKPNTQSTRSQPTVGHILTTVLLQERPETSGLVVVGFENFF